MMSSSSYKMSGFIYYSFAGILTFRKSDYTGYRIKKSEVINDVISVNNRFFC